MPFIRRHHLLFQHNDARPHVARICTQFPEAENVSVLPRPAYSPDMSPIEHVWDALDRRVRQHVPVPANIGVRGRCQRKSKTPATQVIDSSLCYPTASGTDAHCLESTGP